ncbi:unnamed protein product [Haemonchus placei]|uniref:MAM domain-containing protein n=1 Tax=Haemonchus placei TaxID=6290 RepID=A0A0N4X833_HAEPC|nr:unnamed protein product [Haemonchus placei]
MRTPIPLLILLSVRGYAEITSSADLNCDFSTACHWRNATGPEDSGEWIVSNRYEGDPLHLITTRKSGDGFFAYTSGFMGRTVSLLVSEVISCQLGGGNVKYWYFKTGIESQLEVCVRQPPGSKDVNALRCYDGLSPNFIQQWIFRVIELPPLSQPFELVFRGTFYPPLDVIALTEINYTSTLCDDHQNRQKRLAPPLVGFHDWQEIRHSDKYKGETMIVVAQPTADETTTEFLQGDKKLFEQTKLTFLDTTTLQPTTPANTESPPTTTFTAPSTTSTPAATTSTVAATTTAIDLESLFTTTPSTGSTTDPMANFMLLLKQTVPILPYIPILVKSLQADAPTTNGNGGVFEQAYSMPNIQAPAAQQDLRRSPPVVASHFYNTDPVSPLPPLPNEPEPSLVELAKKFGLLGEDDSLTTVSPPIFSLGAPTETAPAISARNVFGMAMTTERSETLPTVYPPKLVNMNTAKLKKSTPYTSSQRPEGKHPENLQELYKKRRKGMVRERIITTTTTTTQEPSKELVIFKKPTRMESEVANQLTELTKYLPSGAVDDLKLLREIPDIEGLTRGMDLSLVSKPGGFAKLKKQFVERLMRRTIGLPVEDPTHSMPPPILPVRITHKTMRERSRKLAKRIRKNKKFRTMEQNKVLAEVLLQKTSHPRGLWISVKEMMWNSHLLEANGEPHQLIGRHSERLTLPLRQQAVRTQRSRVHLGLEPPSHHCVHSSTVLLTTTISEQDQVNASLREWSISSGAVLNSLTGVPHDLTKTGTFIYAGGTTVSPEDTFILSSKVPVELKEPARLDFFVYQAGIKGRLQVCLNTVSNCALNIKGSTIDNKARKWKNYHVPLSTSTHAIHFVADELQDNYAIGLDHIQLLNKYGMAAQLCN